MAPKKDPGKEKKVTTGKDKAAGSRKKEEKSGAAVGNDELSPKEMKRLMETLESEKKKEEQERNYMQLERVRPCHIYHKTFTIYMHIKC